MDRISFFFLNICLCISCVSVTVYAYIKKNNAITELQIVIPQLEKELDQLKKENARLQYEINQFESPLHLMELLRQPEYSHLKFPSVDTVMILPEEEEK